MTMTAQEYRPKCQFAVAGVDMGAILDPKPELCFMRYELTDYERAAVRSRAAADRLPPRD